MPFFDLTCKNNHEQKDVLLKVGERPACPTCGEPTETLWSGSSNVIGDDIPGGIEIKHGICNPDGSPKRYYSKSEIAKAAAAKGYANIVTHVTDPKSGSDKSPYTVRWVSPPVISEEERIRHWHEHEALLKNT